MTTFPRTGRRLSATALTVAAAILATLAFAPAPGASAAVGGRIGSPGTYALTELNGKRFLISANLYTGGVGFATGGVTVGPTTASQNPQTVRAFYRLELWSSTTFHWLPIATYDVSADVPASKPGEPDAKVVMPSHEFFSPPLLPGWASYRVMYTVEWWDKVTGEQLGYYDVYPGPYGDNLCSANVPNCEVYNENIRLRS